MQKRYVTGTRSCCFLLKDSVCQNCPSCLNNETFCSWKELVNIVLQSAVLIPGMARSLCCDVKKFVTPTSWVESCRKLHADMLLLKNYMNIDISIAKISLPPWQKSQWVNLIHLSIHIQIDKAIGNTDCLSCNFAKGPIIHWGKSLGLQLSLTNIWPVWLERLGTINFLHPVMQLEQSL